jgi:hypothetical protein
VLIGPPANQSAQCRFEPSATQLTAAAVPPTARRRSVADQWAPRPASARPRDDTSASSPTFRLWLTPKGKGGRGGTGRAVAAAACLAPRRIQAAHVSQAAPPYIRAAAEPGGSPKP